MITGVRQMPQDEVGETCCRYHDEKISNLALIRESMSVPIAGDMDSTRDQSNRG